jgi:hypothetical protein
MSNPKLQKILSEGLDAPIGSTKRDRARQTMAVIHKITSRQFDGQGGLPIMNQEYTSSAASDISSPVDEDYDNMVIFPAIPQTRKISSKDPNDGQGGYLDFLSNVWSAPIDKKTSLSSKLWGNEDPNVAPGLISNVAKWTTQGLEGLGDLAKRIGQTALGSTAAFDTGASALGEGLYKGIKNTLAGGYDPKVGAMPSFSSTLGGKTYNAIFDNIKSTAPTTTTPLKATPPTQKTQGVQQNAFAPTVPQMGGSNETNFQTGGTQGLTSTPQAGETTTSVSGLQGLADSSPDAGTFAASLMSNPELYKQMFPGVSDEAVPKGASLAGQLGDLQKRLEEENGLDRITEQLAEAKKAGTTLVPDMGDYIRGRDQYIADIDKMIEDTQSKMAASDLGNPETAAVMSNYLNYLYTQKGKQNKKYIDYMSSSIDDFNANITNLNDEYKNVSDRVNKLFQIEGAITEEEYNREYAALTALYNKLTDADGSQSQLTTIRAEAQSAQIQSIVDASKVLNGGVGDANANMYKEQKDYADTFSDPKTGALNPGLNVENAMATALTQSYDEKTGQTYSINGLQNFFATAMKKAIETETDPEKKFKTANDMIAQLKNIAASQYIPNAKNVARNMADSVVSSAGGSVADYVSENYDQVRNAVNDLTSKKRFSSTSRYTNANIQEWIDSHKQDLPEALLTAIAQSYLQILAADPKLTGAQIFSGENGSDLGSQINNMLSSQWKNVIINSVS